MYAYFLEEVQDLGMPKTCLIQKFKLKTAQNLCCFNFGSEEAQALFLFTTTDFLHIMHWQDDR